MTGVPFRADFLYSKAELCNTFASHIVFIFIMNTVSICAFFGERHRNVIPDIERLSKLQ